MQSFKFFLITLTCLACALCTWADYTVMSVEGKVMLLRGNEKVALVKNMALNANDELEISTGAKVEIHNTNTRENYTCSTRGTISVIDAVLRARSQASDNLGAVTSRMRLGAGKRTNTRSYTEGSIKRSMAAYDPEGGNLSLDPTQMANIIVAGLDRGLDSASLPVPVAQSPVGDSGLQFRIQNSFDFPIYINVLKVKGDGAVELSELGQPTGCYVLLPGQALGREHAAGLNRADRHVLVLTHFKFDVDDVLSAIANPEGEPDGLPVDTDDVSLYLHSLNTTN